MLNRENSLDDIRVLIKDIFCCKLILIFLIFGASLVREKKKIAYATLKSS